MKCPHDPKETKGPIGMYHCPDCGDMVIAGMDHPDMDDGKIDDYFDSKFREFDIYLFDHQPLKEYEKVMTLINNNITLKNVILELWLRARHTFENQGVF